MSPRDFRRHEMSLTLRWTGNLGSGTASYRGYSRDHEVRATAAGIALDASADRAFHGNARRWNPELLFLASIAECHMLTYLHLAVESGVVVVGYEDAPEGVLVLDDDGRGGEFESVTLHPEVTIALGSDADAAHSIHERVGALCFIARSVRTPIAHRDVVRVTPVA